MNSTLKKQKDKDDNSKTCIFTICSRNYIHFARTLLNSVKNHCSNVNLVLVLCDSIDNYNHSDESFDVIKIKELPIPEIDNFIFQYNILEINTAIKPFAFNTLFNKYGYDKVIYFDPDICVYHSLDEMFDLLDNHEIILTPHLTGDLDDDHKPNDLDILRCGTYNLGYLGLSKSPNTLSFIEWWGKKLLNHCVVDLEQGLFVDQKWIDIVPGKYGNVFVSQNPGWNVAYWNLNHRRLEETKNGCLVNGLPLVFFHFSGVDPEKRIFSRHNNRFNLKNVGTPAKKLTKEYFKKLEDNGMKYFSTLPYSFGYFPDKAKIPDIARKFYRHNRDKFKKINVSTEKGFQSLTRFMNKSITIPDVHLPLVTEISYYIYKNNQNLQNAFPNIFGSHSLAYAKWFVENAKPIFDLPEIFTEPIRNKLEKVQNDNGERPFIRKLYKFVQNTFNLVIEYRNSRNPLKECFKSLPTSFKGYIYRIAFLIVWLLFKILNPLLNKNFKSRMLFLFTTESEYSYKTHFKDIVNPLQLNTFKEEGINIIGYLHSESGVGEAARSILRAVEKVGINASVIDYRVGNMSRMNEKVAKELSNGQKNKINLINVNADHIPGLYKELGESCFKDYYNIGYWLWELKDFPNNWLPSFNYFQEIWTPSSFCLESISRKSNIPVVKIPLNVEPRTPKKITRKELGLTNGKFIFLSMADFFSFPERKNLVGSLEAFKRAFGNNNKEVILILKAINTDRRPEIMEEIESYLNENSSIVLYNKYFDRQHVNALVNNVDCFLSLHRSEGFGLSIAEAMFMRKPVIATGWSGNMDFMNINNSLPVKYEIVEIPKDIGPYKKGSCWAEPDLDHAAECMNKIVNERELYRLISKAAAEEIKKNYSPKHVGKLIKQRLNHIYRK